MGKSRNFDEHSNPPANPCTTVLTLLLLALFIFLVLFCGYVSYFQLRNPVVVVTGIDASAFPAANGGVSLTFSQNVSVENVDRGDFEHYNSSSRLLYAGSEIGFVYIPSGTIIFNETQNIPVNISVAQFPYSAANQTQSIAPAADNDGPSLEIQSIVDIRGRVPYLVRFTHFVHSIAECNVSISLSDGSLAGFKCKYYSPRPIKIPTF